MNKRDEKLLQDAKVWAEAHREELVRDTCKLVSIKSVSDQTTDVKPYGEGCRRVLDAAIELCESYDFPCKNHEYYCATALHQGQTDEQIGVFCHLDVVPEGSGWTKDPYEPYVKDGYIIGRGSGDNKGPAVTTLFTLRFLRENGVRLKHSVIFYLGCAEETGMSDIQYFLKHNKPPRFSYTADGRYSVCHGEKGVLQAEFARDIGGSNLVEISGGQITNAVADNAKAILSGVTLGDVEAAIKGCTGITAESCQEGVLVKAKGQAAHAAFPETGVSAIQLLAAVLSDKQLVTEPALSAMAFLRDAFATNYGEGLDIAFVDDVSGKTTCVGGMIRTEGTQIIQNINVRYAIKTDTAALERQLKARCEEGGFRITMFANDPPTYMEPDSPEILAIDQSVRDVYGDRFKPYTQGGGTYARKIPQAVAFGPGTGDPSPFGGGHQADEGVSIDNLLKSIGVYALALVRLDEIL